MSESDRPAGADPSRPPDGAEPWPPAELKPMVSLPFVLAPLGADSDVTTVRGTPVGTPRGPKRRLLWVLVGVAVLVVVLLVAGLVWFGTRGESPVPPTPTPSETTSGPPSPSPSPAGLPASAPLSADQFVVPRVTGAGAQLFLARLAGPAPATRLPTPAGGRYFGPSLSPDRRTVVYVDGDAGVLRVMAADGSGDRALFASPPKGCGRIRQMSWSPADPGTMVVQCRRASGADVLLVIRPDGTVVRRLDVGTTRVEDPSISPDGRTVAFWRGSPDGPNGGSIFTVPLDGSAPPTRLTDRPAGSDADPAWSPDGSRLAFRRRTPGAGFDVYLMQADGSDVRRLVGGPSSEEKPAWSPDGTRLLVVSGRGTGSSVDLYRVEADGSGLAPLGLTAQDISTPVWSHR